MRCPNCTLMAADPYHRPLARTVEGAGMVLTLILMVAGAFIIAYGFWLAGELGLGPRLFRRESSASPRVTEHALDEEEMRGSRGSGGPENQPMTST